MSFDIQIGNQTGPFSQQNHDIILDGQGGAIILTGQNKLIQDIQKILFTDINQFYKQYSTQLNELIGSNLGIQQTVNILAQNIGNSLAYLMALQQEQVKYQQCVSSELIENVTTLNVNYLYELTNLQSDLTTFQVEIMIETAEKQSISINKNVTVV